MHASIHGSSHFIIDPSRNKFSDHHGFADLRRDHRPQQLTDDSSDAFDCFVNWAYTGAIVPSGENLSLRKALIAYVLADKLMAPKELEEQLLKAFMAATQRNNGDEVDLELVGCIKDCGLTDSALMDIAIVELAANCKADWETFGMSQVGWFRILSDSPALTMRVMTALRTSWGKKPREQKAPRQHESTRNAPYPPPHQWRGRTFESPSSRR